MRVRDGSGGCVAVGEQPAPHPSLVAIFVLVALLQAVAAFHTPAMEALTQKLVDPSEYAAAGALSGFRGSAGAIAGPLLGGVLIATFGLTGAYLFDFLSFGGAVVCVALMRRTPDPEVQPHSAAHRCGDRRALRTVEARADRHLPDRHRRHVVRLSGGPVSRPVAAMGRCAHDRSAVLFDGHRQPRGHSLERLELAIERQGRVVVIAAAGWGLFVLGAGLAPTPLLVVLCLVVAGGADMISGLFRGIIWNHAVPNSMRGRLAGIAMISYMSGPLLGNARAGWVASLSSVPFSMWSGGLACVVAVIATSLAFPRFWEYRSAPG